MAQTVKLKRSAVAGNVPTTSSLELGELAINTIDGRVFFEKSSSAGYEVKHIITSDSQTTGSLELTGNITASGIVSSSSTGSFLYLKVGKAVDFDSDVNVDGTLSISGFSDVSASLAAAVAGGDDLGNHTATDNLNMGSYSINNLANITASGNYSGSATSTGSFGRVEVNVLEAQKLVVSSSVTNIVTIDVSGSTNFGDSSDDLHSFTGSVVIPSGSLKGEVYVDTNANKMFIGKFTGGIPVSGSSTSASRYATGSDGSIVDLGYSVIGEDGAESLITIGDGIHVDNDNYWYNNKFFKVGSTPEFLQFNPSTNNLKVKAELEPTTGSFKGELYITSGQTGSMFIGKFTGGIPVSGSSTSASRYATGSDGTIVDLGYTTVDEDGNVSLITTGDGIYLDNDNYWYNNKFFKIGDTSQHIRWDNVNLNISASNVTASNIGVTGDILPSSHNSSNLGSDSVRFANLYTADLQLSNENAKGNDVDGTTGNWTIQEGNEDLFIINRKTGKKFKFLLQEIT